MIERRTQTTDPGRAAAPSPQVPLPRREVPPGPAPVGPAGQLPADADLLGRTLAFSGTHVSDDGNVTVRRARTGAFTYSGSRFLGNCLVCARAQVLPAAGVPLDDVAAAVRFLSTHSHGDVD